MNLRAVGKSIAPIQIIIGISMLFTSLISLFYNENPWALWIGAISSLVFGIWLYLICKWANLKHEIRTREGFAITTFSWIFAALLGSIPFYLANFPDLNQIANFTDCFFESMSGFTTTGSSILSNVEQFPKGILFWRSLTHWFGGMGIIVLAIAILPNTSVGGMQMFQTEAPGPFKKDKLMPRIKDVAKMLWKVYFIFTILEIVALMAVGLNWYDAVTHTFGTIATGGFSTYNDGISGLHNHAAEITITIFMILAGINFSLYFSFFKGKITAFFDRELSVYLSLTFLVFGLIVWDLSNHEYYKSMAETLRLAFFQVPAILTTTGYSTANFDTWPAFSKGLLLLLMFVGGSAGSTAGGFKLIRHMVIFRYIISEIKRIINPNVVQTIKIAHRPIEQSIINSVLAFAWIYVGLFALGGLILTFYGIDTETAFSASIASLGNIGPWFNLISPISNYGFMPAQVKWILCFLMLAGRLEIFTLIILFVPSVWKNTKKWRI